MRSSKAILLALVLSACGPAVADIKQESDTTAEKLKKCRMEARAEYYVGQKSEAEALAVYDECVAREFK